MSPRLLVLYRICSPWASGQTCCAVQIFKWELRKGWDALLAAYLGCFSASDNVALYMKTSPYHSDSNFAQHMQQWALQHLQVSEHAGTQSLPTVYVIDDTMSQERLRQLYASVDCFVLPSRCIIAQGPKALGFRVLASISLRK